MNIFKKVLLVLFFLGTSHLFAQPVTQIAPTVQWQKCLGGDTTDIAYSVIQTHEGGYAVAGSTSSNNGDVSGNHGFDDGWVVKLSKNDSIEWQICLGGSYEDAAFSLTETADGNFIVVGKTNSIDGNATGNHGNDDALIIKLDSKGKVVSHKCYGGSENDAALSVINTFDGGYAVAGYAGSNDGDVVGSLGSEDGWILKFNSSDNLEWSKCIGGSYRDAINAIIQTSDSGYAIAGYTSSHDGDATGHHEGGTYDLDAWIVKLNSLGNVQWHKCFGGNEDDQANALMQTSDKGLAIAAQAESTNGDISGTHLGPDSGNGDGWLLKLDQSGNLINQRTLGGTDDDYFSSIITTSDGGVVLAGSTRSGDGDVVGFYGGTGYDAWIVKLNASNEIEWQKCYGGTNGDHANWITPTSDGWYAFAGYTYTKDGDVQGIHGDGFTSDAWVVKLGQTLGVQNSISLNEGLHLSSYPNPAIKYITLGFNLQNIASPVVTITNITGSVISEIQEPEMQEGYHELQFEMSHYPTGSYFITTMANGLSETRRVEVVH